MSVLAIIPARGGSKGIPKKNLADCAGRPLVDWTIQAANDSRLVTDAVLSSDSYEILARATGKVQPMLRPENLAQDETPTEPVMEQVLAMVKPEPDLIVLLQPTSPLRTGKHIDEAIELLCKTDADSVVSVVPSHAYLWGDDGPWYTHRERRQDMRARYEENGAIYVVTWAQWVESYTRISQGAELFVMGEEHRLQVDSPIDLEMAAWLLRRNGLASGWEWDAGDKAFIAPDGSQHYPWKLPLDCLNGRQAVPA